MANVSQVKAKTFAASGANTTAICANQTNSGSGSMNLTNTDGVLVPGNLGTTVTIVSTASDSNSGITFDVIGRLNRESSAIFSAIDKSLW